MKHKFAKLLLGLLPLFIISISAHGETLNWNRGRGYDIFKNSTPDGILIDNFSDTISYEYYLLPHLTNSFSLKFRSKNLHGHPTKRYEYQTSDGIVNRIGNPVWGFFLVSEQDTIFFTFKGCEKSNGFSSEYLLNVSMNSLNSQRDQIKREEDLIKESIDMESKVADPYQADNLWKVDLTDDGIRLSGGNHSMHRVFSFDNKLGEISAFGFFAGWGSKVLISDISAEFDGKRSSRRNISLNNIEDYLTLSQDPMEGYWVIFDRELEEDLMKLGGNYILLCLKETDKVYNEGEVYKMYYVSGGSVNKKSWATGDLKAIFTPSYFQGIYEVEWIDAMKKPMSQDIKAQQGEGDTLLIQFPYQSSKVRLRKLPATSTSTTTGASSTKASPETASAKTSAP